MATIFILSEEFVNKTLIHFAVRASRNKVPRVGARGIVGRRVGMIY